MTKYTVRLLWHIYKTSRYGTIFDEGIRDFHVTGHSSRSSLLWWPEIIILCHDGGEAVSELPLAPARCFHLLQRVRTR